MAAVRLPSKTQCLIPEFLGGWKTPYLMTFGVTQRYRRRGVARLLLGHLERVLVDAGHEVLELNVEAANAAAVAFYLGNGFEEEELVENYYNFHGAYHNAYKMCKRLAPAKIGYLAGFWRWVTSFTSRKKSSDQVQRVQGQDALLV